LSEFARSRVRFLAAAVVSTCAAGCRHGCCSPRPFWLVGGERAPGRACTAAWDGPRSRDLACHAGAFAVAVGRSCREGAALDGRVGVSKHRPVFGQSGCEWSAPPPYCADLTLVRADTNADTNPAVPIFGGPFRPSTPSKILARRPNHAISALARACSPKFLMRFADTVRTQKVPVPPKSLKPQ
jgi:hypothetical protein